MAIIQFKCDFQFKSADYYRLLFLKNTYKLALWLIKVPCNYYLIKTAVPVCSDVYICSTWQIIISTGCEWPRHVRVIIAIILVSAVIVVIVIVIIIIIICYCIIIVIKKIYITCRSGKLLLRFVSLKQLCRPTKPPFPLQMLPAC